jgi:hypothetical protein
MALRELSEKQVVAFDGERKAAMVGNLLVVLCGEPPAQPIVNTGTLYPSHLVASLRTMGQKKSYLLRIDPGLSVVAPHVFPQDHPRIPQGPG